MCSRDDQPRRYENLCLPIVRAVLKMRVVHFHFRPKLPVNVVLKRIIPRNRAANLHFVARRQCPAQRSLYVESSEAFPIGDRGRDDGVGRSILVLTRGKSRLKERRQYVLPIFFIRGKYPVLHEEAPITKSILHGGGVMHEVGGQGHHNNFDSLGWDQTQALCAPIILRGDTAVLPLPERVEPKIFF